MYCGDSKKVPLDLQQQAMHFNIMFHISMIDRQKLSKLQRMNLRCFANTRNDNTTVKHNGTDIPQGFTHPLANCVIRLCVWICLIHVVSLIILL